MPCEHGMMMTKIIIFFYHLTYVGRMNLLHVRAKKMNAEKLTTKIGQLIPQEWC